MNCSETVCKMKLGTEFARECLDLRAHQSQVPAGKCVYIQSGDPSDFDGKVNCTYVGPDAAWVSTLQRPRLGNALLAGYLIGVAGTELEKRTTEMKFALVVGGASRAALDHRLADHLGLGLHEAKATLPPARPPTSAPRPPAANADS